MSRRSIGVGCTGLAVPLTIVVSPEVRRPLGELAADAAGMADRLMLMLSNVDPAILYIAAGLFTALEASLLVGLVLPGDLVVIFLGSTVTSPGRFVLAVTAVTAGSVVGEAFGYGLGRRFGHRLRRSRLIGWIGACRWKRAESFFGGKRGSSVVFGARFVAGIHAFVPIMAGSMRMSFQTFLSWAGAGAATWALVYITAGAIAGIPARQAASPIATIGFVILGMVVVTGSVSWVVARRGGRWAHRRRSVEVERTTAGVDSVKLPYGWS